MVFALFMVGINNADRAKTDTLCVTLSLVRAAGSQDDDGNDDDDGSDAA